MLRPSFAAYRDLGDYKVQFSLLRPNRTRKLFAQLTLRNKTYADGFGVKRLALEVNLFHA